MTAVILGDDWSREALKHRLQGLNPSKELARNDPGKRYVECLQPSTCRIYATAFAFLITMQTRVADR